VPLCACAAADDAFAQKKTDIIVALRPSHQGSLPPLSSMASTDETVGSIFASAVSNNDVVTVAVQQNAAGAEPEGAAPAPAAADSMNSIVVAGIAAAPPASPQSPQVSSMRSTPQHISLIHALRMTFPQHPQSLPPAMFRSASTNPAMSLLSPANATM